MCCKVSVKIFKGIVSQILKQSYLISSKFDHAFILWPPIVVFILLVCYSSSAPNWHLSPYLWLIVVVGIDVAHVYATIFRTYLDPVTRANRLPLLVLAPLISWILGVVLYSYSSLIFWRVLAYLAVFHFIRQQYGFFRLYERKEGSNSLLGKLAIYSVTLYPILYWHFNLPRRFSWFVEGDFINLNSLFHFYAPFISILSLIIFAIIQCAYLLMESRKFITGSDFSYPKNLLYLGTFLSWYGGIVLFNGDLTFTLTNVICHGVPYIALVWGFNSKKDSAWKYSGFKVVFYLLILLSLAYIEEGLWDFFVWDEHKEFFLGFTSPIENKLLLAILVSLLTVPQMTHYILDAFIWRISKPQDSLEILERP